MLGRRQFLSRGAGLAASLAFAEPLLAQLANYPASLPDRSQFASNEDAYWAELRKQFLIPADEIYLNNGTVGSSPAPVLRAVFDSTATKRRWRSPIPRTIPSGATAHGTSIATLWRRSSAAIVMRSRWSAMPPKANNYIANGVDMKAGDEVLITDQEHPGGSSRGTCEPSATGL